MASRSFDHLQANTDNEILDVHLHAQLEEIDNLVNDVEMSEVMPLAQNCGEPIVIVLDTNILLHHLETIDQFILDAESSSLSLKIMIPGAVVNELDGQKNRDGLAWFARRASTWLLKRIRERKLVYGQQAEETCKASGNWKKRDSGEENLGDRYADYLIWDCCRYFKKNHRTLLCSNDTNLCVEAETAGCPSISPSRSGRWSSRDIALALLGNDANLTKFSSYKSSYRVSTIVKNEEPQRKELSRTSGDMSMDVDHEDIYLDTLLPRHALDLLHTQVIEHFTRLLLELVGHVTGRDIPKKRSEAGLSVYAPVYARKDFDQWDAQDCFEYLEQKKSMKWQGAPTPITFLKLPYSGRGARRGQDWARMDWQVALASLRDFGEFWKAGIFGESITGLVPILNNVFASPMRPTGS